MYKFIVLSNLLKEKKYFDPNLEELDLLIDIDDFELSLRKIIEKFPNLKYLSIYRENNIFLKKINLSNKLLKQLKLLSILIPVKEEIKKININSFFENKEKTFIFNKNVKIEKIQIKNRMKFLKIHDLNLTKQKELYISNSIEKLHLKNINKPIHFSPFIQNIFFCILQDVEIKNKKITFKINNKKSSLEIFPKNKQKIELIINNRYIKKLNLKFNSNVECFFNNEILKVEVLTLKGLKSSTNLKTIRNCSYLDIENINCNLILDYTNYKKNRENIYIDINNSNASFLLRNQGIKTDLYLYLNNIKSFYSNDWNKFSKIFLKQIKTEKKIFIKNPNYVIVDTVDNDFKNFYLLYDDPKKYFDLSVQTLITWNNNKYINIINNSTKERIFNFVEIKNKNIKLNILGKYPFFKEIEKRNIKVTFSFKDTEQDILRKIKEVKNKREKIELFFLFEKYFPYIFNI